MHFMAVKKLRNHSGVVVDSYLKDSEFAAVKGMLSFKLALWKEYHKRYTKGVSFLSKMVLKMLGVGSRVGASQYKTLLRSPHRVLSIVNFPEGISQ